MNSPPSAMVFTRETSCRSAVFHATTADFGAFILGYLRVVGLTVIQEPAFGCGLYLGPAKERVRALLGARQGKGAGSTWSPPRKGCGLYLEPAKERVRALLGARRTFPRAVQPPVFTVSSCAVNCFNHWSRRPRSSCSMDTINTPMPSLALTLRTTARTRTCPCGVLNTNCSIVPAFKGSFVRIKRPPSARFSTGETNFWVPFFHATNAFLGTLARGYRRLFCVSVMDNPYHYDILIE